MDFDFSFEQRLLGESVGRMLAAFPAAGDRPFPYAASDVTRAAADLGLFAREGGIPMLGAVDAVAAALEIGRALPAAPLTEMLAASLALAGSPVLADALSTGEPVGVAVAGALSPNGGRALVPFAEEARLFALPLETDGRRTWHVVDRSAITLAPADVFDVASTAAWVEASAVPADELAASAGRRLDDLLALLALAEMTGAAAHALDLTVSYAKERRQFGRPIGQNQAIKHMAADAAVSVETMKAAVEYAAWCIGTAPEGLDEPAGEAHLALLSARSHVGDHARRVAEACTQMHGGIAFTWDYGLHRTLKRIVYCQTTLAAPRPAREALADVLMAADA
ncbi:alkylation response protein AidB-like acyl-CoA dehydrogenase [Amorphus suaedae]